MTCALGCHRLVCIGSLHWDYVGRAYDRILPSGDQPGIVFRSAGGVAFNVARALRSHGFDPELVSAVGSEADGDGLIRAAEVCGIRSSGIIRPARSTSDSCLVVEDPERMVAAIADCRLIEATGAELIGRFADCDQSSGIDIAQTVDHVVLDCNLPADVLDEIANGNVFPGIDLSLVSASTGKIDRALMLRSRPNTAVYANLAETRILLSDDISCAAEGAKGLVRIGFDRAIVTNGKAAAADATRFECCEHDPKRIEALRYTGAGDQFAAAHIAARLNGENQAKALALACERAVTFVANGEE